MKKHGKLLAAALGVYVLLLILLVATEARAPDANIRNVWDAIWYSLITMTTVGYGDLSPVTPAGRVLGLIFALSSIGILTALISLGIQLISGQFLPRMRLQMNRKQKWYVFNEQTPEALTLAARLKAAEPHSLFLFPQAAESTEKDASFVLMDAGCEALTALRGSSDGMVFFGMSGDCWKNYEQGLDAAEKGIPAYCMTDFSVDRLPAEMHLFSLRDVLSRSYWKTHPLRSDENQIVLIGSGSAGSALLERALLTNVFEPGRRVTYHVFGNPDDFAELHPAIVRALVPEGDDDILHLYSGSWSEQRELLQTADRILLCADSEQENLSMYGQLHSWFATKAPIHLLLQTPVAGLNSFGDRETVLTPEFVMQDEINRLAVRMNELYNRYAAHPTAWRDLSEFLRESNIAAADHLPVKVRYLLQDDSLTSFGPKEYRQAYRHYISRRDAEADLFQEMEHRRWLRFYWMYNWDYNPVRDNSLRRHPMILPYRELSLEDQNKDAYAWELLNEFAAE